MELLVALEQIGEYSIGDILAVKADGERWGREEHLSEWVNAGNLARNFPNPFIIIAVPSEPPDLNLTEPEIAQDPLEPKGTIIVRKRAWRLRLGLLADQTVLRRGRRIELTRAEFRSIAARKIDGAGPALTLRTNQLLIRENQTSERTRLRSG